MNILPLHIPYYMQKTRKVRVVKNGYTLGLFFAKNTQKALTRVNQNEVVKNEV